MKDEETSHEIQIPEKNAIMKNIIKNEIKVVETAKSN